MAKIIQICLDADGDMVALDSDGRVYWRDRYEDWVEYSTYPIGCDPDGDQEMARIQDTPPGSVF